MKKNLACVALVMFFVAAFSNLVGAQESPTQVLRAVNDEVGAVLKSSLTEQDKQAAIRNIIREKFNLREMAIKALGRPWKDLTPEKKDEYVAAFTEWFLQTNPYVTEATSYSGKQLMVGKESVDGNFATVKAQVTHKGAPADLLFKLSFRDAQWRIYDVEFEGVSLVSNYNAQFQNRPPETLIALLKNKT
jgi:phospholipid transport system substrate-binding protein